MGLEHTPDLPMGIMHGRFKGSSDFRGVMRIIINDGEAVYLSFILKAPIRAREGEQPFLYGICRNAELIGQSNGGKGIGYVMLTRNAQTE